MPFLNVDGCDVHYEVQGSGPTIVLTQGGLSPTGAMLSFAGRLSDRYHVVLWDRANIGASQVCFDDESELDISARHLRAVLEHLGVTKAFLSAPSEGTRVNVRAALRYPDLVAGLFLWEVSAGETGAAYMAELLYEQYARIAEIWGMAAVVRTPWWSERIKSNLTNRRRLLDLDPGLFVARMRRWAAELRADPNNAIWMHSDDEVRQVTCPAWIVEGVDLFHPRENSERLAKLLPNGRFVPAPYDISAWDDVKETEIGLQNAFVRYADFPGIFGLLEEFLEENTATSAS